MTRCVRIHRLLACSLVFSALVFCSLLPRHVDADQPQPVRISEEPLVIPTYQVGPADPHPMFYMNESYQGAQKRIYPYALQDHLIHERKDQTYTSLRLENEFVQLCVLPEIGWPTVLRDRQDERLRFLLPSTRDQAGLDRHARGLDLRRRRMVCLPSSSQHHVHAGRLHAESRTPTAARRSGSAKQNAAIA